MRAVATYHKNLRDGHSIPIPVEAWDVVAGGVVAAPLGHTGRLSVDLHGVEVVLMLCITDRQVKEVN